MPGPMLRQRADALGARVARDQGDRDPQCPTHVPTSTLFRGFTGKTSLRLRPVDSPEEGAIFVRAHRALAGRQSACRALSLISQVQG